MCGLPTPMHTEPDPMAPNARIQCTLQNDPRLIAGVAAVVAHVARRAGLSGRAEEDVSTAAAEACREAFLLCNRPGAPSSSIQLAIADLSDRVEVTIESSGGALPAAGPPAPLKGAAAKAGKGIGKPLGGDLVERVERETRDGRTRVTLVKYCDAAKSRPKA
jgi:anti-sigma regulatory factor (Ser/Thr protein kinase)